MIALTAYGVKKANKAYKKHKAEKELQKGQAPAITDPSYELRSCQEGVRPVSGGLVNYASSTSTGTSQDQDHHDLLSPRQSTYSESSYSQSSATSPVTDFRQYQQYVERQSHGFLKDTDAPPSYDVAMSQYQPPRQDIHPAQIVNTPPILANSPYLAHQHGMRYYTNQDPTQLILPQYPPQPTEPPSNVNELPDTGTYRSTQGDVSELGSEPVPAISELAADVPTSLRIKHTPNGQEEPGRFELPAVQEGVVERQESQRKRSRSTSRSSRESDQESLHKGDLAKI